ncbi:G protein-activated inward rectifier potassium channel 3 [Sergentomyia squamirostris]
MSVKRESPSDQYLLSSSWDQHPPHIVISTGSDLTPSPCSMSPGTPTSPCRTPNGSIRRSRNFRPGTTRRFRRRAVFKHGEVNVIQSKLSRRKLRFLQDIFTTLVDTQWRWTLLIFALSFILSWLGFAVIWWLICFTHGDLEAAHLPPHQEENNWSPCVYNIYSFASCFLFSIETQHTIGYGFRTTTEECPEAIFMMCMQSIYGVMTQAFMVGIVFAKMTRPKHRSQTLLFSKNAVICQRDGDLCLMFRVGDMRKSHIIGANIRAQLIKCRTTKEGEFFQQFQTELAVGTDGCASDLFFIWPMIVVHKINEDSPFYTMSASDMLHERFEIVVILEGTVESTGQSTQTRSSYLNTEILWGHRFESVVSYNKERQSYDVDYRRFNETVQVDTPLCSAKELSEFCKYQEDLSIPSKEFHYDIGGASPILSQKPRLPLLMDNLRHQLLPGQKRSQSHNHLLGMRHFDTDSIRSHPE